MRAGGSWQRNGQGVMDDIHVGEVGAQPVRAGCCRRHRAQAARSRRRARVLVGDDRGQPVGGIRGELRHQGEVVVRPDAAQRPRELTRVRLAAARDPRHEGEERKPDPRQAAGLAGRGDHAVEYTLLMPALSGARMPGCPGTKTRAALVRRRLPGRGSTSPHCSNRSATRFAVRAAMPGARRVMRRTDAPRAPRQSACGPSRRIEASVSVPVGGAGSGLRSRRCCGRRCVGTWSRLRTTSGRSTLLRSG